MQISPIQGSRKVADDMTTHAYPAWPAQTVRRWLSPVYFGLAALAFLLPFATVSCDNASTSFTGVQLVTHTVPAGGHVNEAPDCSADISSCVEAKGSLTATVALVAALIGLALGLMEIGRGAGWCAGVGFGATVLLPFETDMAEVSFHIGYVLALVTLLAACGLQVIRRFRQPAPGAL